MTSPLLNDTQLSNWTASLPDSGSDHIHFFASREWHKTELGPLSGWSPLLQAYVHMCMADSRPACLYMGDRRIAIYNEAFAPLCGAAHPALMSNAFEDIYVSIWEDMKPVFLFAEASRKAVHIPSMTLMVDRNGYLEEAIFLGNFNPLIGESGKIVGFYNSVTETTKVELRDRRTNMLNLIACPTKFYTTATIGQHIIESLATLGRDVPAAIIYKPDEEHESGRVAIHVAESIGIPENHVLRENDMFLDDEKGLMPLLRKAKDTILTVETPSCFQGVQWTGFEEPSKHISVVPCLYGGRIYAYLVVGANPRRPNDEDHHQFMSDLARQIALTMSAVISKEETDERQRRLERELADSERKIMHIAKHAHVGLMNMTTDGFILWANDHAYDMLNAAPGDNIRTNSPVVADDRIQVDAEWEKLSKGESSYNRLFRLKKLWTPPSGPPESMSLLVSAFPYMESGTVQSLMCCMLDVSHLKWAERWQARSAEEARDAKLRQDEFIDLLSHEVRNPLSAIFQLADSIIVSNTELFHHTTLDQIRATVGDNVESAKTILLCARHQKRIVDDVLTLSRLNFTLLSLTPSSMQPSALLEESFRMFNADLLKHDITLQIIQDESYSRLGVDWIMSDPSRVTQININLISNAIKFTKSEEKKDKKITVEYGATLTKPERAFSDEIYWIPRSEGEADKEDAMRTSEWGTGEELYLTFSVEDTGAGMKMNELKKLCTRFEQANHRTQVKYGGSGLGLFISHKLVQKLGGNIGCMSTWEKGSTFVFYIKVRRAMTSSVAITTTSQKRIERQHVDTTPTDTPVELPLRPSSNREKVHDPLILNHSTSLESPKQTRAAARRTLSYKVENLHVLLVEDNLVNQQILRRQLMKAGCTVHVANHGLEALDVLQTTHLWHTSPQPGTPLDLILMDWEMPVMDGLACSREIRIRQADGRIVKHVPIIAVTANSRREQVVTAIEAGIDEVLTKPFVIDQLMERILANLGRESSQE